MPADPIRAFSDTELLDQFESMLRNFGTLDLCLGCDPATKTFYAGSKTGPSLREVLMTALVTGRTTPTRPNE